MKVSDELKKYINHLYDSGHTASSDVKGGMSTFDEEQLTALIIQSSPRMYLPNPHEILSKDLWDLAAHYMKSQDPIDGADVLQYVVQNLVNYYKPQIENLMEQTNERSQ